MGTVSLVKRKTKPFCSLKWHSTNISIRFLKTWLEKALGPHSGPWPARCEGYKTSDNLPMTCNEISPLCDINVLDPQDTLYTRAFCGGTH